MAENNDSKKSDTIEIPIGKYVNSVKSFGKSLKTNLWMTASIVLAIVIILLLIFGNGAASVSGKTAGNNLVSYIKAQGQDVSLVSVSKGSAFYNVTFSIKNQTTSVPVTLDGKYAVADQSTLVPLTSSAAPSQQTSTATLKISDLNLDDYLSIGNKSAKVTVVEFSDFSCPYCEAASGDNAQMVSYMQQNDATWQPIGTNLMKDYVDTGKVRFVYIYSMGHSGGHSASSVAWCLNDQNSNLFEKFYSKAFAASSTDVENLTIMQSIAKSLGADMNKLQQCLDSKKYDSRFASEQSIATQVGAQGTPAFFVNDQYVAHGAQSYVQFKQAVDAALAQ
ncbi:MAG: thioredoxin domain-containing protein [archaeon]